MINVTGLDPTQSLFIPSAFWPAAEEGALLEQFLFFIHQVAAFKL